MKKGIMSILIAAGLSAGAIAQNYNNQPNYNSQPNLNQSQPYQNGTMNNNGVPDNSINGVPNNNNNGYTKNNMNTVPGTNPDVQPLPQQPQPGTNYQLNGSNTTVGTPYDQSSAKGQNMGPQNRPNTDLNSGTPGAGDSLLRDQSRLDDNAPVSPFEENGREAGFLNQNIDNSSQRFVALANMPDPPTKNNKNAIPKPVEGNDASVEAQELKERDKAANAVPDWVKANVEAKNDQMPQAQCALNNELSSRPGNFKEKSEFNGGSLYLSRERDGEEKVKFNSPTEFYRYEKTEKGKERFSYGVTKDYETMELKKNDDGTAEVMYHGIFQSVDEAEDAIMKGIVVEEMGSACRGVYRGD